MDSRSPVCLSLGHSYVRFDLQRKWNERMGEGGGEDVTERTGRRVIGRRRRRLPT